MARRGRRGLPRLLGRRPGAGHARAGGPGRAAYEEVVRRSFAWARPRRFEFHHLAVDGDVVFADWTIAVERRDGGQTVEWRGMSVAELRDGRIVWWREYYEDPVALARAARG